MAILRYKTGRWFSDIKLIRKVKTFWSNDEAGMYAGMKGMQRMLAVGSKKIDEATSKVILYNRNLACQAAINATNNFKNVVYDISENGGTSGMRLITEGIFDEAATLQVLISDLEKLNGKVASDDVAPALLQSAEIFKGIRYSKSQIINLFNENSKILKEERKKEDEEYVKLHGPLVYAFNPTLPFASYSR
ncbi:MAG: hypothetical protein FWE50_02520 [Alphaproteobacteria bacterium]|nr:hypothetical protein [Alphaproteobacteria bacterium]